MWRRPATRLSVCPMSGRISRSSPLRPTRRRSRMFGRSLPSIRPCELGTGGPGQLHRFVWQEFTVPMSSRDRPRRAAGSSRWTGGHHRDLLRAIASRVVTHGLNGIFQRQIESRAALPVRPLSFCRPLIQHAHDCTIRAVMGQLRSRRPRRNASGYAHDAVIWTPRRQSSVDEMGKASVH